MTQIEYHLKLAIYHWCGADPSKYVPDSFLRDVWSALIPQIPYEPEGIRRLGMSIYGDPIFQGCTAAHNLVPQEFFKGGDIQTVKQLYIRLLPCEPMVAPVPLTAEAMF
jgi:hypothetical protein